VSNLVSSCVQDHHRSGSRRVCGRRLARRAVALLTAALSLAALSGTVAFARSDEALELHPEFDQGLLGEGRLAYRERADQERALDAYRIFKQSFEQNPGDAVAGWHLSMACYWLGMRVYTDSDAKKAIHDEGRRVADRALALDPDCGPCHLLSAINHALWADQVGIFRTLVGLPKVKRHLARAAELDPGFAGAAAYRVEATILDRLPRMFGGGKKKARRAIEQAIAVAPEEPLNYEFLANMLVNRFDDVPLAVTVARRGLAVPEPGPAYVESRDSIHYLRNFIDFHSTLLGANRR